MFALHLLWANIVKINPIQARENHNFIFKIQLNDMKKVLFILAFIMLTSFVVKSQNTENYYLPDFIDVEYCSSFLFYDQTDYNISHHMARNHYNFWVTGASYETEQGDYGNNSGVLDRAQPCYTDTLLTVRGIAIGINYRQLLELIDKDASFVERAVSSINCCDDFVYQCDDYYTYNDYLYHLQKN